MQQDDSIRLGHRWRCDGERPARARILELLRHGLLEIGISAL